MKAVILAAGYGTRLYPLTRDRPKALLPIHDMPMLERILEKLAQVSSLEDVYIVSNARFYPDFQQWIKTFLTEANLHLYNDGSQHEKDMLGAVRDIQFIIKEAGIHDDLIVVAGDNLFEFNPVAFYEFAVSKTAPCVAIKDLGDISLAHQYGSVKLDQDKKFEYFEEKCRNPKTALISTCFYYFPKNSLGLVDRYLDEGGNPDAPGYYIQWLYQQCPVYGWEFTDCWFDIGSREVLQAACELYEKMETHPA